MVNIISPITSLENHQTATTQLVKKVYKRPGHHLIKSFCSPRPTHAMRHLMEFQDEILWFLLATFGVFVPLAATNKRLHTLAMNINASTMKNSLRLDFDKLPVCCIPGIMLHPWMQFTTILYSKYAILEAETLQEITKHPWKKIIMWSQNSNHLQDWNTTQLSNVNFWWQRPRNPQFLSFCSKNLQHLTLGHCALDTRELLRELVKYSTLKSLTLRDHKITKQVCYQIGTLLSQLPLTCLNLYRTPVGDSGFKALIEHVPNLRELSISTISRTPLTSVIHIGLTLRHLEKLDVSHNNITTGASGQNLLMCLALLYHLKSLNVAGNTIFPEAAVQFRYATESFRTTLRELNMGFMVQRTVSLDQTATDALCAMLTRMPLLETLNISGNNLDSSNFGSYVSCFTTLTKMTSLILSHNNLKYKEVALLGDATKKLPKLKSMNLEYNKLAYPSILHSCCFVWHA